MTKQGKIGFFVAGMMALFSVVAPAASYLANAPADVPPPVVWDDPAPAADAPPGGELVFLDAVVVEAPAPALAGAPRRVASRKDRACHVQALEQGGRPGARTVRVCL